MNAAAQEVVTESPIAEYRPTEAALADLRQRYATAVFDVRKSSGMAEAKAARAELRKLRVALEAERVSIKAPALERCRQIDGEAKRINAELVSLEDPIDDQIKAEESRKEKERKQREEAELKRIAEIQERIAAFAADAGKVIGQPAVVIKARIERLVAVEIGVADFDEFVDQALEARTAALAAMEEQLERQQEHEAEQARIQQERAELEQLRAQQAEAQRVIEENNRRIAEEAQAERDRKDEEARLERQRQADEERAERDRVAGQRQLIADLKGLPLELVSAPASLIEEEIERLTSDEHLLDGVADDFRAEAESTLVASTDKLRDMLRLAKEQETLAAQLRQQRDDQERERQAEQERQQAEREELRRQGELQAQERRRLEAEALANVTLHDAAVSASEFLHAQGFGDAQPTRMLDAALSRDEVTA